MSQLLESTSHTLLQRKESLQYPTTNGQFSFAQLTLSDKELSDQHPDIGAKPKNRN